MKMPVIRIIFQEPWQNPKFIGNEIEPVVTLDMRTGILRGAAGSYISIPDDPSQPSDKYTSQPFEVQLNAQDIATITQIVLQRAYEQGSGGIDERSTFRID
jgi:hypothetical protein